MRNATASIFPPQSLCRSYWKSCSRSAPPDAECVDRASVVADRLGRIAEDCSRPFEVLQQEELRYLNPPRKGSPSAGCPDRIRLRHYRSAMCDTLPPPGAPTEPERKCWCRWVPSTRDSESGDSAMSKPAQLPGRGAECGSFHPLPDKAHTAHGC